MRTNSRSVSSACPRGEEWAAHALGQLSPERGRELEEHLAGCAACAAQARSWREVVAWLHGLPDQPCAPDLAGRVMAALAAGARPAPRIGWPARLRWAAIVVAALGLGLAALRLGRPRAEPRSLAAAPERGRRQAQDWLYGAQEADGGWRAGTVGMRSGYAVGVSSLALLALLEPESAPRTSRQVDSIRRGVDYLLRAQDGRGMFGPAFSGTPYNHGLATLALLQACALESNAAWRAAATRALAWTLAAQQPSGGWKPLNAAPDSASAMITLWPLLSLIRADEMGFPGLRPAVARGVAWLRRTVNADGLMDYGTAPAPPPSAAGALALLRATALPGRDGTAARSLPGSIGRQLKTQPARARAADRGKGGPDWDRIGGPVYATALAAMTVPGE